ncbi:MAG: DUF2029 domain-containing protein [Chloroflexi bacterium]|nr:DUF2029 domain-containing protein [Chloroflexota bacterium]OJV98286.1 MAG: hypothetical protein BGO39_16020 [Chloroflexi bacterium 54-19]
MPPAFKLFSNVRFARPTSSPLLTQPATSPVALDSTLFNRQNLFFWLKTLSVVLALFIGVFLVTLPSQTYSNNPYNDQYGGISGMYGTEKFPDGTAYLWMTPQSALQYNRIARYAPVNLRLTANLSRPAGVEPAAIEVYESTVDPPSEPRLVTTLHSTANGITDYYLTVPARPEGGEGLILTFKSNSFTVPPDTRKLGFIFLHSELSLGKSHLLHLFWPQPYWVAGLLLLLIVSAWAFRAGLNWLETFLLGALNATVLVTMAATTYTRSWWLLGAAVALAGVFAGKVWWDRRQQLGAGAGKIPVEKAARRTFLFILAGSVALVGFFLFSGDEHAFDINFFNTWSRAINENGLWNIYQYSNAHYSGTTMNYFPFIPFMLSVYNLVVYPLGLQGNNLVWRIFSSLLFFGTVLLVYLLFKADKETGLTKSASTPAPNPTPQEGETGKPRKGNLDLLIVVAFNAAIFVNPAIWGQSDIIATFLLVLCFYLVWKEKPLWGGFWLGMAFMSKPQIWFPLPLLTFLLIQKCGWKKTLQGLAIGAVVSVGMFVVYFGGQFDLFVRFFGQTELAGAYNNAWITDSFNLNFLLLGYANMAVPLWVSLPGFALAGATLLGILYTTFLRGPREKPQEHYSFASGLHITVVYTLLIKMKERYNLYGLPLIGLAAMKEKRRLLVPFFLVSWLHLVSTLVGLYQYNKVSNRTVLPANFMWWSDILSREETRRVLSAASLVLLVWLLWLYFRGQKAVDRGQ